MEEILKDSLRTALDKSVQKYIETKPDCFYTENMNFYFLYGKLSMSFQAEIIDVDEHYNYYQRIKAVHFGRWDNENLPDSL